MKFIRQTRRKSIGIFGFTFGETATAQIQDLRRGTVAAHIVRYFLNNQSSNPARLNPADTTFSGRLLNMELTDW